MSKTKERLTEAIRLLELVRNQGEIDLGQCFTDIIMHSDGEEKTLGNKANDLAMQKDFNVRVHEILFQLKVMRGMMKDEDTSAD